MPRRPRSNPLALAILSTLQEGPRHPYDISVTLKTRQKHESIRLNYGSLYNVVGSLLDDGFIEVVDTIRDGARPERTVYGITEAGLHELSDWLTDLVANPQPEFTRFEAALSLLPSLPPDEAVDHLEDRLAALDDELRRLADNRTFCEGLGLPRLFILELDYVDGQLRAEHTYVTALVADIRAGTLEGLDHWRSWHARGPTAAWTPDPSEPVAGGR